MKNRDEKTNVGGLANGTIVAIPMGNMKNEKSQIVGGLVGTTDSNEKVYNPYMFGQSENPIDYWGAVVHLIRSTIGTGILVLPFAFKKVGFVLGIVGCIFTGLLYVNTVHALLFTEYELCKRLQVRNLSFVRVVEETFAGAGPRLRKFGGIFKALMYFYYGVPVGNAIYLIIVATNAKGIVQYFLDIDLSLQQAISLVVLPITALCMIPKLKFLVPFSVLTNVFTLVNICVITLHSLHVFPLRSDVRAIGDIRHTPQFFALVLQSLYVTGLVLPLKNEMQKPRQFSSPLGVMNVAFIVLISLYTAFGLVGYLNYGPDVRDNILANLPQNSPLTATVYLLYALALCVTYTLLFYVYFDTIWTNVLQNRIASIGGKRESACAYALRLSLSLFAYITAIAVPNFALLSSIVGTVGIVLEIALPAILQNILLLGSNYDKFTLYRMICKNILVVLLAFPMCLMSLKSCIVDIIDMYS